MTRKKKTTGKRITPRKTQRKAPTGIIGTKCMDKCWQTPPRLVERISAYFPHGRIPFDAATSEKNPLNALKYATESTNSLVMKWPKQTYINPPYGDMLYPFIGKITWEALMDNEVLALLPCSRWEQRYLQMALYNAGRGTLVCFIRKRVNFIRPSTGDAVNGNTYANMFVAWNGDQDRFVEAFSPLGACLEWKGLCPTPPEN